jgi:hypothetical protein
VFGGDASVDSLRMADRSKPSKKLKHRVIQAQAKALDQCSADCGIVVERVTTSLLVWSCASPGRRREPCPFISHG